MARMFKPVIPGPSSNKKTAPQEQKSGQRGKDAEEASQTGQKDRYS